MADSSNKTGLIIDAQLLQTNDRDRGMGLFLTGMLEGLSSQLPAGLSLFFVVNNRLPALRKADQKLIESLKGTVIEVELLHQGDNAEYMQSADVNHYRLDQALAPIIAKAKPAQLAYYIPALFSSQIHPVFPSSGTTNLLLFHDLIPFLYYRHYFQDHEGTARKDYAQRFREVYRTDTFVTNSQTTADDLMVYAGVDPARIVPILGAAAERRRLTPAEPSYSHQLSNGFVFMPSGDDLRKNNARAVQAFANLHSGLKLVVTSRFSDGTKRELQAICPNIIFAGSVSDEEFLWLLDNAQIVFFPPEYEGLGMPILEAIERDAIVACSNIPVFLEISQQHFFYFDPRSVSSIETVLGEALKVDKKQYLKTVKEDYARILADFSWTQTASKFLNALEHSLPAGPRKKLAIFCPSPSSYSAVGKYAFEVHAELSRLFDIDYYAEDGLTVFQPTRPNILEYAAGYYPAGGFTLTKAKQYDYILYNLGNSEFHTDTILNALRLPANAVIHDTRLNGIFDWLERQGFLTPARRQLEARLDEAFQVTDTSCLISLLTNQQTAYCHSSFAQAALQQISSTGRPKIVQTIHPIGVPHIRLKQLEKPTISFAGIISEDKGISLVAAVAKSKDVLVKIFGYGVLGDSPLLQGLGDNVRIIKDLTDLEFQTNLQQTDILVNYRPNYHGETSRSVLEAMRYGVVVLVKDIGWYSELPDDTVVKIRHEAEIEDAIKDLIDHPEKREAIAKAARQFLQKNYGYGEYAMRLRDSLQENRS